MTRKMLMALAVLAAGPAAAQAPADLNDLQMAHAAVTASNIDIRYAHLALAISESPAIREFAEAMIRDHTAVNDAVFALARRLGVEAQANGFSRQLLEQAAPVRDRLSGLRGREFDRAYIENELRYHEAVNGVVERAFIPNIENDDVRRAFQGALANFRGHEAHARRLVQEMTAAR